ncbi:hypothetical protein BaRGS_00037950 [Batillaria attramentaria]|uniref:TIR domain-containing protein n=1 Tax=Batillaria attramentaria TaxID=370345 RepID=A0ABD0J7D1_9CAEN
MATNSVAPRAWAEIKLQELSELFSKTPTITLKDANGSYTKRFIKHFKQVELSFWDFDQCPLNVVRQRRQEVAETLVRSGSVPVICQVTCDEIASQEVGEMFNSAVNTIWNNAYSSADFSRAVLTDGRLVPLLLRELEEWLAGATTPVKSYGYPFLQIIESISRHAECKQQLRHLGTVDVLQDFLRTTSKTLKVTAMIILANIVDGDIPTMPGELVLELLEWVRVGLAHNCKSWEGRFVTELVGGVRQLSKNETNSRSFVKNGVLDHLMDGLRLDIHDLKVALDLSKVEGNAQYFMKTEIIDTIADVGRDGTEDLRRTASQLLKDRYCYSCGQMKVAGVRSGSRQSSGLWLNAWAETVIKEYSALFNRTPLIRQRNVTGSYTDGFVNHLEDIEKSFSAFSGQYTSINTVRGGRKILAENLVKSRSIQIICRVTREEIQSQNTSGVLLTCLTILWNYTNTSASVSQVVLADSQLVKLLLTSLKELTQDNLRWPPDILRRFTQIIDSLSRHPDCIHVLRKLGAYQCLVPLVNPPSDMGDAAAVTKLCALSALANMANDKEVASLTATLDLVRFLLQKIAQAFTNVQLSDDGWFVTELMGVVRQLSKNDDTSKRFVQEGVLKLLLTGLQSHIDDLKYVCIETALLLCLVEDNTPAFLELGNLLDAIVDVGRNGNEACRRTARSILWQLRGKLLRTPRLHRYANEFPNKEQELPQYGSGSGSGQTKVPVTRTRERHVMLSYQWDDQPVVRKVCEKLREHGFQVWMDLDNMAGSIVQCMAEGVENAFVVIICMSQKYKDSINCRQEASYAHVKKKEIIPLKMQDSLELDGWLGLIVAGKLFYDFSGKEPFEEVIKALISGILRGEPTNVPSTHAGWKQRVLDWSRDRNPDRFLSYVGESLRLDSYQASYLADAVRKLPSLCKADTVVTAPDNQ